MRKFHPFWLWSNTVSIGHSKLSYRLSLSVWLLLAVTTSLGLQGFAPQTVYAEGFVEPAFEQQWKATDEAVAKGQASRTYFWGPQAFAHTNEVYVGSPNGGQRRVQYFDKARMELGKKPEQSPGYVTNGLLTVELVSGRLQVGDNDFLSGVAATNPVAGDPANNQNAPTYATFKLGKLAFGVEGAQAQPGRIGQKIEEAVSKSGEVSTSPSSQVPTLVKYSSYFGQTGHNLAEIFERFFEVQPLGKEKWLAVMGYPITEPYWAKDKVIVAGQPRDVLIQLFERRVLTYTPANPAGFQVEMGNIGQHYYLWRYNLSPRDQLPPNLQVISLKGNGKELYSTNIASGKSLKLTSLPSTNSKFRVSEQNKAVVNSDGNNYLVDLTQPDFGKLKKLSLPQGIERVITYSASWSRDGKRLALLPGANSPANPGTDGNYILRIYGLNGVTEITGLDVFNAKSTLNYSYWNQKMLSTDGNYLAYAREVDDRKEIALNIVDLTTLQKREFRYPITSSSDTQGTFQFEWVSNTNQVIVRISDFDQATPLAKNGRLYMLDASTGTNKVIAERFGLEKIAVSPNGNLVAVVVRNPDAATNRLVNIYNTGDLTRSVSSYNARLDISFGISWGGDGTYYLASTYTQVGTSSFAKHDDIISAVNGQVLWANDFSGFGSPTGALRLTPFHYILRSTQTEGVSAQNLDSSNKIKLDVEVDSFDNLELMQLSFS